MKKLLTAEGMNIHKARPIKWIWSNRLVDSSLNLIVGNEGVGKGTLVAFILAKLSVGKLQGNLWEDPCNVAIIGNEDSFHHVWGPRLWAVHADPKRVFRIRRFDLDQVEIRRDISDLAEVLKAQDIKVVYFDQFLDNLSIETDHYHAKQVRSAINPLQAVAEKLEVTVIATLHPNKRAENFRQLVQGTSAFNAISRSSLLVADHPDKEGIRVLVTGKSNYGVRNKAWEFKILEEHIRPNGRLLKTSMAMGFDKSSVTVEDLITASKGPARKFLKDRVQEALKAILVDGEWHSAAEVYERMEAEGLNTRTARRVAGEMGVDIRKSSFEGGWKWRFANRSDSRV